MLGYLVCIKHDDRRRTNRQNRRGKKRTEGKRVLTTETCRCLGHLASSSFSSRNTFQLGVLASLPLPPHLVCSVHLCAIYHHVSKIDILVHYWGETIRVFLYARKLIIFFFISTVHLCNILKIVFSLTIPTLCSYSNKKE